MFVPTLLHCNLGGLWFSGRKGNKEVCTSVFKAVPFIYKLYVKHAPDDCRSMDIEDPPNAIGNHRNTLHARRSPPSPP